jgi:hypothetical protein
MRIISIIKYLFTVIGVCALLGALLLYINTHNFISDALTVNGTVIDLIRSRSSESITYRPVIEFETRSGKRVEFISSSGSNPPSYSQGESVEVLYQASSPEEAKVKAFFSLWGGSVVLSILGSVFFIFGFSMILFGFLKTKNIEYLKKYGVPIMAEFNGIKVIRILEVNSKNPYQICAKWKDPATSKVHIFKSYYIWFNPTGYINNGEEITVLIEEGNPKKYYVDISFLPGFSR